MSQQNIIKQQCQQAELMTSPPTHHRANSSLQALRPVRKVNRLSLLFQGFRGKDLKAKLQTLQTYRPQLKSRLLEQGGIQYKQANLMIQNCIGKISVPLGVSTGFVINDKPVLVPMSIQEPSVIAASSAASKFIADSGGFRTYSTDNIMIGQIQIISSHSLETLPYELQAIQPEIRLLAAQRLQHMLARGGGLHSVRVKRLPTPPKAKHMSVVEILVNVCEAMGANLLNTLCQQLGQLIQNKLHLRVGLRILTNYCSQRLAYSTFQIPLDKMVWKGVQFAHKIIEAQEFAKRDIHRASTHNKGIMNGIDALFLAAGQDWRAEQAACHTHACRSGIYQPLTYFEIIQRDGNSIFKGHIEIPVAVGTVGGAIEKNPVYKQCFTLMGNPSSRQLGQIAACVGLAQNFGALRALVVQGIQKGHMRLHSRTNL